MLLWGSVQSKIAGSKVFFLLVIKLMKMRKAEDKIWAYEVAISVAENTEV